MPTVRNVSQGDSLPVSRSPLKNGLLKLVRFCCCCCSVAKLCPTLHDLWTAAYHASPSLTISQHLPKFMSIESVMPSNHLILSQPVLLPSVFPRIKSFPLSELFTSGGQRMGASASASKGIQGQILLHC